MNRNRLAPPPPRITAKDDHIHPDGERPRHGRRAEKAHLRLDGFLQQPAQAPSARLRDAVGDLRTHQTTSRMSPGVSDRSWNSLPGRQYRVLHSDNPATGTRKGLPATNRPPAPAPSSASRSSRPPRKPASAPDSKIPPCAARPPCCLLHQRSGSPTGIEAIGRSKRVSMFPPQATECCYYHTPISTSGSIMGAPLLARSSMSIPAQPSGIPLTWKSSEGFLKCGFPSSSFPA